MPGYDLREILNGSLADDDEENLLADPTAILPSATPELLAARQDRDKDVAMANISQGLTQIGAGLAGQKADTKVFDAARASAEKKATEALTDNVALRKTVSDAIKAKAAGKKALSDEEWKKANFEQRDRMIEATANKEEAARNKPSDANNLAAGYGKRMEQAEQVFDQLGEGGYNRADKLSAIESNAAGVPVIGDVVRATIMSKESQQQEQAEKNFLSAVLRRESGASISPNERSEGATQYFPRVGDSPEVLAQKKANRQQAMESLKASSGPAWSQVPSVSSGAGGLSDSQRKRLNELRAKRNAAK